MNENDLLPCPFCGDDKPSLYLDDENTYTVECKECGGLFVGSTEKSSRRGWNNRQYRKLPSTLAEFKCSISKKGWDVLIQCEDGAGASEILEWLTNE